MKKIVIYSFGFSLFSVGLSIVAFMFGMADAQKGSDSVTTNVLHIVAFWPSIFCSSFLVAVGIFDSSSSFYFASIPMYYFLYIPAIGWGLVGSCIGFWSRRHDGR